MFLSLSVGHINLAGLPARNELLSKFPLTTDDAPTKQFLPIFVDGKISEFMAMTLRSPIDGGLAT